VTLTSMPGYEYAEGRVMWVQEPFPLTELPSSAGSTPTPTCMVATLGCEPYYTDWSVHGVVDVYDDSLVPDITANIRLIDVGCSTEDPDSYSWPLEVRMAAVGDVVQVDSPGQYGEVLADLSRRGVEEAIVQPHLEGTVVKFYGVVGTTFFRFYSERDRKVAPMVWDPGMVKEEIEKKIEDLLIFKEGGVENTLTTPKGLVVTFYVDRRGRVLCAGMTAEETIDEEFAERFITNLKKIKFVEPDERYAKVTYTW